jgi:hypothetical protein
LIRCLRHAEERPHEHAFFVFRRSTNRAVRGAASAQTSACASAVHVQKNGPDRIGERVLSHVEAPDKQPVVTEGAGHFPHLTDTTDFLAALAGAIRPTDAGHRRAA